MIVSVQTFLGVEADTWAAWGLWATIVVYIAIAVVALRQLQEARALRIEQARPFVIVDAHFRSLLIQISIRNIGASAANNVSVRFDDVLTSTMRDPDWQASSAFTDGLPMMAPGREMLFNLDTYPARHDADLPMVIKGSVTYVGRQGKDNYDERFIIDLTNYEGSTLPDKGMHDLVHEVEEVRKELHKWTDGIRGIAVNVTDRQIKTRRENRPRNFRQASRAKSDGGWRAYCQYWIGVWRTRGGWYSR